MILCPKNSDREGYQSNSDNYSTRDSQSIVMFCKNIENYEYQNLKTPNIIGFTSKPYRIFILGIV